MFCVNKKQSKQCSFINPHCCIKSKLCLKNVLSLSMHQACSEYCSNLLFFGRAGTIWVQPVCCPDMSVLAGSCDQMLVLVEEPLTKKEK